MKSFYYITILVVSLISFTNSDAQKKDSTWMGVAEGFVQDSGLNYVLQSATLAIYIQKDSNLIGYQLSNNFGEFHFDHLPTNIPLYIIASYVGYTNSSRKFTILRSKNTINLKGINLTRDNGELPNVVVVALPPVRMNGDTLEFNADAFRMDKNAVAEDLLRRLPGITIWGDGKITFNGRPVSQVLVEGKPFFGGDTRIATQNVPKDAIDKIQVYQQNKDKDNPRDSVTNVNIKLKKDKKFGQFGKLAAGYGSTSHYEADGNINFFTPQTQLGIVGASNNINKIANDVTTLMRNSTFKGVGANIEYQPDFRVQGTNKPNSAGFTFLHEFTISPDYRNDENITANYFLHNNNNEVLRKSQTITLLRGDSSLIQNNTSNNRSGYTENNFNAEYYKLRNNNTYSISLALNDKRSNNQNEQQANTLNTNQALQSTNNIKNESNSVSKGITIGLDFNHRGNNMNTSRPQDFTIGYSFSTNQDNGDKYNRSEFIPLSAPAESKRFDRSYSNSNNYTQHHLSASIGDLSKWIVIRSMLTGVMIQFKNDLDISVQNKSDQVMDRNTTSGQYLSNQYLTNNSKSTIIDERPLLNFKKGLFNSQLADRYSKRVEIDFNLKGQFFSQINNSTHAFQNLTRDYRKFVPTASISYNNNQWGDFQDTYSLSFNTIADYPTINQLVPLVDSSNQYYIQEGNIFLKPSDKKELSFNMQHNSLRIKNTFTYNINITAGMVNHGFADSTIINSLGESTHFTVNANGNKYLNTSISLNKAFKFNDHQLQFNLLPSLNFFVNPNNVNGSWNTSRGLNQTTSFNVYYTFKDWIALNMKELYSYYHSKQTELDNNTFSNSFHSITFSASINFTKKLCMSSNIGYNYTTSTGVDPNNFTIWNATAFYRLMEGNNLELKFSALDLLHQNTSIINDGSNNSITHGTSNVLKQYFMFTLAYYPRKFGKKGNADTSLPDIIP